MAWDTDATKRKLLDAGSRQFAASGFAGARIEAIGADAGVNKERIYRYFGDKRSFFAAVLTYELTGLLEGVTISGTGPEAIGDFTDQLLDRCETYPELSRLLIWESLELDEAVAVDIRHPICTSKATGFMSAMPALDQASAEQLLASIVTLAVGWCELGNLSAAITGAPTSWDDRRVIIRSHAVALATGLNTSPGVPAE